MGSKALGIRIASLALLAVAALLLAVPVAAQEGGPPPLPILYEGQVYLNGELLSEPGRLTVRIGEWESRAVAVVDGSFRCGDPCLIAGPPDQTYIGQRVTFHLNGEYQAGHSFDFPELSAPAMESVTLEFSSTSSSAPFSPAEAPSSDGGSMLWWSAAGIGLLGLAGGGAWYIKSRRPQPALRPVRSTHARARRR